MHEEALRVNRMCRGLRKKDILQEVLKYFHERSLTMYEDMEEEDDFHVSHPIDNNLVFYCFLLFRKW